MQLLRTIRNGDFSSRAISGVLLLTLVSKATPLVLLKWDTTVAVEVLLASMPLLGGIVATAIIVPLRRRLTLVQEAIDATQAPFVIFDRDDRLVFSNRRYREVLGLPDGAYAPGTSYETIIGRVLCRTTSPARLAAEVARRVAVHRAADGRPADFQFPGGRWDRLCKTRTPRGDIVGIGMDVTESYVLRERLETEVARFTALADRAPVAICEVDGAGALRFANTAFLAMFGAPDIAALDTADVRALLDGLADLADHDEREVVVGTAARDVMVRRASVAVAPDARAGGTIYILVDITERKKAAARMRQLALHDALTGAYNRVAFAEDVAASVGATATPHRAVLIAMDLDRFKPVNDVYGHRAGDDLLRQVAGRIGTLLPDGARLYRTGGDEFCVLGAGFTREAAAAMADALLRCLLEPFIVHGHRVQIGVSIGISAMSGDVDTADALVHFADLAMYRVKENGGNKVSWFDDAILTSVTSRQSLESDLVAALEARDLTLCYQPIFGRDRDYVLGLEALVRWTNRRTGRTVSPGDFIPLAEETGLIQEVDLQVFALALEQFARWEAAAHAPDILTINMSTRTLESDEAVARVIEIMRGTGVNGRNIVIEVTESFAVRNAADLCRTIRFLAGYGLRFAIDDFGTGYTSFRLLADLPIDLVKIDKSFVNDLTTADEARSSAIIRAVLNVANDLRLGVVAEGVETEAQLALLQGMDCALFQGHLLGVPLAGAAVTERLRQQRGPAREVGARG